MANMQISSLKELIELCKIGQPCPDLVLVYIKTARYFTVNADGPPRLRPFSSHRPVVPFVLRVQCK